MKNTETKTIAAIKELFNSTEKNITIIPHENPDGDAIGSASGLGQTLINTGHKVKIISPNDYPVFLKWFSTDVPIIIFSKQEKEAQQWVEKTDLLICVDFNDAKRTGKLGKLITNFGKTKIMIDHHPFPTDLCDHMVSETSYSSTAELAFDVITKCKLRENLTTAAAEALYTGILTDTGGFSHNTSKNTFRVVSELLDYDIKTNKIQSNVFHNYSAKRLQLLGYCLNKKMKVFPELRAAVISISQEELELYNFQPGDTEGFVNYPLSIKNIIFSALFIEKDDFIKASFRSKGNFPANEFSSKHFNGGGHLNAAGGKSRLDLDETLKKFTALLPEYKTHLLETKIG